MLLSVSQEFFLDYKPVSHHFTPNKPLIPAFRLNVSFVILKMSCRKLFCDHWSKVFLTFRHKKVRLKETEAVRPVSYHCTRRGLLKNELYMIIFFSFLSAFFKMEISCRIWRGKLQTHTYSCIELTRAVLAGRSGNCGGGRRRAFMLHWRSTVVPLQPSNHH